MVGFEFDPFDPAYFDDPYPYYRELRRSRPVFRREIENHRVFPHYWMLTRSKDVNDALSDWRTFTSTKGTVVDIDVSLLPLNIFHMDPPRHDELRGILSRVLTPKRISTIEPIVRNYATELVHGWKDRGAFDASTEFAQMIPTITMCTFMDLPTADRAQFLQWNLDTLGGADFTDEAALKAYAAMAEYWQGIVAERKKHPGPDVISQILHAQVEGEDLSDIEISGFCSLLHDASQNTTMNMITNSVISLARFPDQRRRLATESDLWPRAIEELLRYESPVQGLARATTCDVTIDDVTIPEGDQVLLLYGSANHDESVYENPDVLDFDRVVKNHWAFGHGMHYCLGNAVARLETLVTLQVLVKELGDWEIDEAGVVRNQLVPTRGVAHAPVRFDAHA